MKIEEGKSYEFRVIKNLNFEGKEFFLFEGPDFKRYLLPAGRYKGYNIEPGLMVTCRIDKINCKGEVFLEPVHPVYREKEAYLFEVTGSDMRVDRAGKMHRVLLVKDYSGNILSVPGLITGDYKPGPGEKISLVIDRIAKGNIIFSGVDDGRHTEKKEDDTLVDFMFEKEVTGLDGRTYFMVRDNDGTQYPIPADYYRHYGLKPGKKFQGRFVRYKAGEEVRVEPLNPFFIPGRIYTFRVMELVELDSLTQSITVVQDEYGYRHNLDGKTGYSPGSSIELQVERIRKGWPLLKSM